MIGSTGRRPALPCALPVTITQCLLCHAMAGFLKSVKDLDSMDFSILQF